MAENPEPAGPPYNGTERLVLVTDRSSQLLAGDSYLPQPASSVAVLPELLHLGWKIRSVTSAGVDAKGMPRYAVAIFK